MSFFSKHGTKTKYIIIVGCGRLGAYLANTLSARGEEVLIIDRKEESFLKLSTSFGGMTLVCDAAELFMNKEFNVNKASAVIAVTNIDNTNIMIAQMAKEFFNIDKVIARLYDPEREVVYDEFGIKTICPVVMSSDAVTDMLYAENEDKVE